MTMSLDWDAAAAAAKTFTDGWGPDAPGGAVIGFDLDGIRFSACGGMESLATLVPFSARSVVRYASVTKHAFCAMVLSQPELIGLDDRLGDHLPELQAPLAAVSVGQALDMSGGLPDTRECVTLLGLSVYTETRSTELLNFIFRQTRLNYEAGTEISYSNTGYRLVEAALARKGMSFKSFIQAAGRRAGAEFDAPDVWHDPVAGLVPGYWRGDERWQLSSAGLHLSASGSMTGSGESLVAWLRMLMADTGPFGDILQRLASPRLLADGRPSGYGLGLRRSVLDGQDFIGHGGSHPGYKTYFLLDPDTNAGFVVVSNREDTNGYGIALQAMAALRGLPLPRVSTALIDGLYVTQEGPWWIKVAGSTVTYLDADETIYDDGDGWVSSRSASSPLRLRMDGDEIVGEVGHAARRFVPVRTVDVPETLSGEWISPEGARLEIAADVLTMGIGPVRHGMPLAALGNGRFLFTLKDGPWTKRVCIHMLADDRLELVLGRARMMEYTRRH
ncbi:serine hydrolase domain-containing protein [Rhizobium sp. 0TCS1.26]|uniref:serine hydrolase domain-containing protein n=1 Tax=Rhizobium sp. 0TCS1.26 TaxID=3142623 RepID=UPI003D2A0100